MTEDFVRELPTRLKTQAAYLGVCTSGLGMGNGSLAVLSLLCADLLVRLEF